MASHLAIVYTNIKITPVEMGMANTTKKTQLIVDFQQLP